MRRLLVILAFSSAIHGDLKQPVLTDSGPVSGVSGAVTVFKGIPYAAPPVGNLRWRPPQRSDRWEGTRGAVEFGAICMQDQSLLRDPARAMSEDCLTLNIWTPASRPREKHPVMVWIHGGGFRRGSSSQPQYDGERLARRGAVVVSLNYRLGVFGFLAHPQLSQESHEHVSGNYGLLDQIAALQWVQRNIAEFGGDPGRVTLFGESAGGFSVFLLATSPLARGLFHRAIAESGSLSVPHLREDWNGEMALETRGEGLSRDLAVLRAATTEEIIRLAELRLAELRLAELRLAEQQQPRGTSVFMGLPFRPVVDGWVLPEDPTAAYQRGHQHNVPLLAGTNADEGTLFTSSAPSKTADSFGATMFVKPTLEAVSSMSRKSRDTYLYRFSRVNGSGRKGNSGSYHGSEIPYVFGTLDVVPLGFGPVKPGTYDDTDLKLSEEIQAAWVRFAATGNPNGPGFPEWPAYHLRHPVFMDLGDIIRLKPMPR